MVATARRYTVVLTPDVEDGGYVVSVPALPGCVTEGDTIEEALANAQDLIRLYIQDLQAHGEPVPEETQQPALAVVEVQAPLPGAYAPRVDRSLQAIMSPPTHGRRKEDM